MPSPLNKKEKNGTLLSFFFFFGVSMKKRETRETKEEKKRSFVYFNIDMNCKMTSSMFCSTSKFNIVPSPFAPLITLLFFTMLQIFSKW